jgi:hypothetical protein
VQCLVEQAIDLGHCEHCTRRPSAPGHGEAIWRSLTHVTNPTFFGVAWMKFSEVNVPVPAVGAKIGGKVEQNIKSGIFQNACPIRMSYVLNYTGVPIPQNPYATASGTDGKWYMYRVNDMMTFLEQTFGQPDKTAKSPKTDDFSGLKGLIVVKGSGWSNARGHVTLWNGTMCSDTCHLLLDPDNGTFTPEVASLWALH